MYSSTLSGDSEHLALLPYLGVLRLHGGQQEDTAEPVRSAARDDPANAVVHTNLGTPLDQHSRRDAAIRASATALAIDIDRAELCYGLLRRSTPDDALTRRSSAISAPRHRPRLCRGGQRA
jgi:Flp pilus assembly protein TadD